MIFIIMMLLILKNTNVVYPSIYPVYNGVMNENCKSNVKDSMFKTLKLIHD